jgi:hypothetical protein
MRCQDGHEWKLGEDLKGIGRILFSLHLEILRIKTKILTSE